MIPRPKLVAPLAVLLTGAAVVVVLFETAPEIVEKPAEVVPPLVEVVPIVPRRHQMRVFTHGTVSARTESELVPEVSGRAVWVSPQLVSGGFFEQGDALLEIEPVDYEVALERARAAVARAESEHARALKELDRLRGLTSRGIASQSQLDDAERGERVAAASLRECRAAVAQAERDLERTTLRAPYTGRVRRANIGVGQFVSRGVPVASLYAIDRAEIRLPIADEELAFIELPLLRRGDGASREGPPVVLRAQFAGVEHQWVGRVVRTEGEIDMRSRMVNVVAVVDDPYAAGNSRVPPLAVGMFVEAEILGKEVDDAVVASRAAMRDRDHVLVVDADDRMRLRRAQVIRRERRDIVLAAATFQPGDRIVSSAVETAVDGMRVRPVAAGPGENSPFAEAAR